MGRRPCQSHASGKRHENADHCRLQDFKRRDPLGRDPDELVAGLPLHIQHTIMPERVAAICHNITCSVECGYARKENGCQRQENGPSRSARKLAPAAR